LVGWLVSGRVISPTAVPTSMSGWDTNDIHSQQQYNGPVRSCGHYTPLCICWSIFGQCVSPLHAPDPHQHHRFYRFS